MAAPHGAACRYTAYVEGGVIAMTDTLAPLDTLAAEINARLELTGRTQQKAKDHRIAAGLLLDEARRRIQAGEAGNVTWTLWEAANIRRSPGDIRKLIKHANASGSRPVPSRNPSKRAAGRTRYHLPRPRKIERAGERDEVALFQIALTELALRDLARRSKEAYDMVAASNRPVRRRCLSCDDFKHLDAAIAAANAATEIEREAIRSFIKATSPPRSSPKTPSSLVLDKPTSRALPQIDVSELSISPAPELAAAPSASISEHGGSAPPRRTPGSAHRHGLH